MNWIIWSNVDIINSSPKFLLLNKTMKQTWNMYLTFRLSLAAWNETFGTKHFFFVLLVVAVATLRNFVTTSDNFETRKRTATGIAHRNSSLRYIIRNVQFMLTSTQMGAFRGDDGSFY
jgi:hypothetical protein